MQAYILTEGQSRHNIQFYGKAHYAQVFKTN